MHPEGDDTTLSATNSGLAVATSTSAARDANSGAASKGKQSLAAQKVLERPREQRTRGESSSVLHGEDDDDVVDERHHGAAAAADDNGDTGGCGSFSRRDSLDPALTASAIACGEKKTKKKKKK